MIASKWYYIVIGCLGSAILGMANPLFALLFGDILGVSFEYNT